MAPKCLMGVPTSNFCLRVVPSRAQILVTTCREMQINAWRSGLERAQHQIDLETLAEVSGNRLVDGVASGDLEASIKWGAISGPERLPEVMARVTGGGFGHKAVAEAPAGKPLAPRR